MFEVNNLVLWALPLLLAVLLRLITHKFHHQLIFPLCKSCVNLRYFLNKGLTFSVYEDFITVPAIFYVVVAISGFSLPDLRKSRWIFDMGASAREPWFKFYSYLDFAKVNYTVLWSTLPTQFALSVRRRYLIDIR